MLLVCQGLSRDSGQVGRRLTSFRSLAHLPVGHGQREGPQDGDPDPTHWQSEQLKVLSLRWPTRLGLLSEPWL